MTISLNVLEHLGMNLYSNIPSVSSVIVANAWDADATKVEVNLDKNSGRITIEDDGKGMSRDEVIDHFLSVGFKRRDELGQTTQDSRIPMGRKCIDKLSAFSLAQVVEVYTVSKGELASFRLDRRAIRNQIGSCAQDIYVPEEPPGRPEDLTAGARVVLLELSRKLT